MYHAMDAARTRKGLTWRQVAQEIWDQSAALNARRQDHPISASTLTHILKRRDCTCQHALFILRWLKVPPETFVLGPPSAHRSSPLPEPGPERRLRWDLKELYAAANAQRSRRGLTWRALAAELRCTPSQLTGLRNARFAIGMRLAMRLVRWLDQPASAFVYVASW